jgi:GPH family glycoside/pentoside/hexuronide:cation symporter
MQPPSRKVSTWEIVAFAAPAAPLLAITLPTIMFLPQHYMRDLGIEAGAFVFVLARMLDVIIDPLLGGWQDRTVTRWGRRRFWLVLTCPILMALVYWAFLGLAPGSHAVVAGVAVLLLFSAYASMMIAHLGWAGELIPTYHGRTRTLGMVQILSLFGQVGVLALAAYVMQSGGDGAAVVNAMGWLLIIMLPTTTALAVLLVPERKLPPQAHLSLIASVRAVWANTFARRVLFADLLFGIAQGIAGTLFVFYFQFVLGFERESNTLLFLYFVAGLIGVPAWMWLARRWGKHRAMQTVLIYTALTTLILPLMPPGNFAVAAPLMALAGLGQGGGVLLSRALMADVVDEDELRTGARRSGLYFGLLLTTSKLAIASGPLALVMLQLIGFDVALGGENSPLMLTALGAMFIGAPVIVCAGAAWVLQNYPLDEKAQAALGAAIEARHAANNEKILGPSTT